MTLRAKLTVTTGPDRGKTCELTDEVARVGRSTESHLVLSDPDLADHLASIVQRDGRFAIITTVPQGLEIDGTEVPVERWVWLPEQAEIRVSSRTALEFSVNDSPGSATSTTEQQATPPGTRKSGSSSAVLPRPAGTRSRRAAPAVPTETETAEAPPRSKRAEKKQRTVAKFITDGPGDPLVKLGEDGHLPELQLAEGLERESTPRDAPAKQTNPAVLYLVLAASLVMTLLMLFFEDLSLADSTALKASARREIVEYYGEGDESLKAYQVSLRRARQAWSRGDTEAERQEYRKVLNLLRSEAKDKLYKYTGLTGRVDYEPGSEQRTSDRRLEELIGILLSE